MGSLIVLLVSLLVSVLADRASAEPVTTIRDNGDPANRVDIVILGDGYTAAEMFQYAADVDFFVNGLFAQEPFTEYQRYFNVHRVDVTSNESGADHPERNVFRDTSLHASYNCFGIQRLICVDTFEVFNVLQRSVAPEQRDVVVVIVNDFEYGGSGGAVAVASVHPQVVELVLHELGHSFGLLADEYDTDPQLCDNSVEPPEPNVTAQTNPNNIKWNVGGGPPTGWIDLTTTPIPTPNSPLGVVGLYQGARYCTSGLYRPTYDSKMRSLDRPYEQVNTEQLVKRIYNWVSPIDSSSPVAPTITLPLGASQDFSVQTPRPSTGALDVIWRLNGQVAGKGSQFTLASAGLSAGNHIVEAFVQDLTPLVRHDPANVLTETLTWTVNIDTTPLGLVTVINSGPPVLSKSANAVFVFAAPQLTGKFSCSLDNGPFTPCKSPKRYSKLANGIHTFDVMVSDSTGIVGPPASYSWTVDAAFPDTSITSGPPALSKTADALFNFTSSEGGSAFQCKLNKTAFVPCSSPLGYRNLPSGKHTFQVAAIDGAGNIDKKAALYKWTIDTTPPETKIRSKPPATTKSTSARFNFFASQRGSTFECSLNGAPFTLCTGPVSYNPLFIGGHTFQVRATDPAGNTDPTPASYSWTVQ
jgi:hypothetical protein